MRKIGEGLFMLGNRDEEATAQLASTIVDATKSVQKLHYANEVMSSMLAKINIIVKDDDLTTPDMVEKILLLLEWYDMYQAGIISADIVGTKLSEKSRKE